jgi:hypothetical protein
MQRAVPPGFDRDPPPGLDSRCCSRASAGLVIAGYLTLYQVGVSVPPSPPGS